MNFFFPWKAVISVPWDQMGKSDQLQNFKNDGLLQNHALSTILINRFWSEACSNVQCEQMDVHGCISSEGNLLWASLSQYQKKKKEKKRKEKKIHRWYVAVVWLSLIQVGKRIKIFPRIVHVHNEMNHLWSIIYSCRLTLEKKISWSGCYNI